MRIFMLCALAILGVLYVGCAHNTIQPIDGVTITAEADIDNVDAGINVNPPKLFCAGESKLPFPTGKLGGICDAVRSSGGEGDEAVDPGSLPEASGEATPVSDARELGHGAYAGWADRLRLELMPTIDTKKGLMWQRLDPLYLRPGTGGAVLVYEFS